MQRNTENSVVIGIAALAMHTLHQGDDILQADTVRIALRGGAYCIGKADAEPVVFGDDRKADGLCGVGVLLQVGDQVVGNAAEGIDVQPQQAGRAGGGKVLHLPSSLLQQSQLFRKDLQKDIRREQLFQLGVPLRRFSAGNAEQSVAQLNDAAAAADALV